MITGRAQLFYYPINEIINLSYLSVLQVCVLYFPQIANTFHIMNIKTDLLFSNYSYCWNEFRNVQLKVILKTGGWGCIHLNIKCMLFWWFKRNIKVATLHKNALMHQLFFNDWSGEAAHRRTFSKREGKGLQHHRIRFFLWCVFIFVYIVDKIV